MVLATLEGVVDFAEEKAILKVVVLLNVPAVGDQVSRIARVVIVRVVSPVLVAMALDWKMEERIPRLERETTRFWTERLLVERKKLIRWQKKSLE